MKQKSNNPEISLLEIEPPPRTDAIALERERHTPVKKRAPRRSKEEQLAYEKFLMANFHRWAPAYSMPGMDPFFDINNPTFDTKPLLEERDKHLPAARRLLSRLHREAETRKADEREYVDLSPETLLFGELVQIPWNKLTEKIRYRKVRQIAKRAYAEGLGLDTVESLLYRALKPFKQQRYIDLPAHFYARSKANEERKKAMQMRSNYPLFESLATEAPKEDLSIFIGSLSWATDDAMDSARRTFYRAKRLGIEKKQAVAYLMQWLGRNTELYGDKQYLTFMARWPYSDSRMPEGA